MGWLSKTKGVLSAEALGYRFYQGKWYEPETIPAGLTPGGLPFGTSLQALVIRADGTREYRNLGPGLVTNVGVQYMANDFNWAAPSGSAQNCLKLANQHAWGTGASSAATDIALGTLAAPTTTAAVAGAQTFVSAANSQKYQSVATITAGGTLAITEWGLHLNGTLTQTTGTPLTAVSATTATVTGTPYTASSSTVAGTAQSLIIKTGTTASYGMALSNTTSVITIPAWYKVADGTAGTTPGGTEAFTLLPVIFDHKNFSVINVNNGDSIQFTYQLTVATGG